MTKLLYSNNTYLFESQANIIDIKSDQKGDYLLLDQTIFYPQGGGQPCDTGAIILDALQINVISVKQIEDEIRHYINGSYGKEILGKNSICKIDQERRMVNAKYHTAAHLLGNIVEYIYPELKAVKGHSFPGEAYVEFSGAVDIDQNKISEALRASIKDNLKTEIFEISSSEFEEKFYKLPYPIPNNKIFRAMKIGDYPPIPCGGTHIKNINEIKNITLPKITTKTNHTKILYDVL